ncbi:conserved hypothetical protein [Leishmania mexicana MHOM/GT/2001/U1103]|uniref:Flagellar attachment zone protein n=1 Tax=Leishmania mexicana (strain MHOM/GT/2001/U1103) TaxID=929439 RepID=E9B4N8_LEIMU|nr:conserved hypothetical protein [Leishmania mexicana MHOM/GT/2001/U1103]CBZ30207.1 conserved hypothetical protein [Leishmania mexicana MHOM/GT/2001/U1103]
MSFSSNINPPFTQLQPGQVVAYDYLHAAKTWQWTLGTVREIKDYTAVVQQWGLHTGDIDTLRSILLKEVDTENGRMKNYHDMLGVAREKLASIRRSNEDRVSHVRGHFDKAREKVELIDEVDLRKVTAQAAPSPVAVAVLKAVWAVAKCDPTAVEFYEWADVQLEYRKTAALDEIAKTDVLTKPYPSAESLQQSLEQDPKLNYKAAARNSPVVASLHAWVTTALAYQQAYNLLAHDKRIQEQNDAIAAAIAGMKACRAKIAKLKDELSSKDAAALPGQVTSFTRTSVLVTIPLSAVISPVNVDSDVKGCVLTKDEVEQILLEAKALRFQLKSRMNSIASRYVEAAAELHTLSLYTAELEKKRLYLQEHYFSSIIRNGEAEAKWERTEDTQKEIDRLNALVAELQNHDERWEPDYEAVSVATSHVKKYPGAEWAYLIAERFEEVRAAFASDTALAVHVDPNFVQHIKFVPECDQLCVRCEITHPAKMTRTEVDERLSEMPTRLMNYIYKNRDAPKTGLDRAVTEICHALGIDDHKFAGLGFDEFVTQLAGFDYLGDKDAYESEIGDLLMLLDKINNENRSLQYTLEKSAERFKKQAAVLQRDQDALTLRNSDLADEIDRLQNLVAKLKDLADKQGAQLEHYHMQHQEAQQLRAHRNLSPIPPTAEEPLYAVTIDELNAQKALCDEEKQRADNLETQLDAQEAAITQLQSHLHEAQCRSNDLDNKLQLAAQLSEKQQQQLDAFHQQRRAAKDARADEPELAAADGLSLSYAHTSSRTRLSAVVNVSREAVDPATLAADPLYVVTLDEYKSKQAALHNAEDQAEALASDNERLAAELERAQEEAERLAGDLEKAEEEAETLAGELQKAQEEGERQLADNRKLASDNERLAAELERAQEEAERLAGDLEKAQEEGERQLADNRKLASDNERLAAELERAQEEAERLAGDLEKAEEEAETLAGELQKAQEEGERQLADNRKLASDNERLAAELERAQEEAERLAGDLEKAEEEAETLAGELQKAQEEGERQLADNRKLASDNERLAAELERAQEEAERLAGDLEKAEEEAETLAGELQKAQEEGERQLADNRKLASDNERLAAELERAQEEAERLAGDLEKAEEEAETLAGELQKAQEEGERQLADNRKLASDNERLAAELERAQEEAERLAGDLEKAEEEAETLAGELQKAQEEGERQLADNRKLASDNERLAAELERAQEEAERLAGDLEKAEEEAETLAGELQKAQEEGERQLADNRKLASDNERLAAELERAQEEAERLAGDLEKAEEEAETLAGELQKAQEEGERQLADNRKLASDNERLAAELERAQEETERLAGDLEKAQEEGERQLADNRKLASDNERLAAELERAQEEAERLAGDLEKAEEEAETLAGELQKAQEEGERQLADNRKLASDNERLAAELERAQEEAERLAGDLEKAEEEAETLAGELQKAQEEGERQLADNRKLASDNERLAAELERAQEEAERLAGDLEKAEEEAETLAGELQKAQEEGERQLADNRKLASDNERLAAELERAQEEAERLAGDLEKAEEEAETLAGELQKAQEEGERQLADNRKLASDNERLAAELERAQEEAERLAGDLEKAQEEGERQLADNRKLASDNERLAAELERAQEEAERLAGDLEKAEEEAETLAGELQKAQEEGERQLADNRKLASDNERLAAELERAQEEAERLAGDLEKAEEEAETLAGELQKAQEEGERQLADNRKLASDNERLAGDLEKAEEEAETLAGELQKAQEEAESRARVLADKDTELAAFRAKRSAAKEARTGERELAAADGVSPVDTGAGNGRRPAAQVPHGGDSVDPATIAAEPLYVVTLDEYKAKQAALEKALALACAAQEAAEEKLRENSGLMVELEKVRDQAYEVDCRRQEDGAAMEGELLVVLMELKKLKGINDALLALLRDKECEVKELRYHNELWEDPPGDKKQIVTRHTKIFDGNWERIVRERPEALFAAFIIDSGNACHVPGNNIKQVSFDHD